MLWTAHEQTGPVRVQEHAFLPTFGPVACCGTHGGFVAKNRGVQYMLMAEGQSRPAVQDLADSIDERLKEALHDIRQPLAAVFALAECARSTPGLPIQAGMYLDQLMTQADEAARVARSALDPVGATAGLSCFGEVIGSVLESFSCSWSGRLIRLGYRGSAPVRGCRTTLRRCVVNLLDNATHAAGPHGTVRVTLDRAPEQVRVLVEDDGPGFGRVVPRFGVGLKGTRRALAPLGGSLSVRQREAQDGACVILSLPLAAVPVALPNGAS